MNLGAWWRARRDPTFMPEDLIRRDRDGRPDLEGYDRPLDYYVALHRKWAEYLAGKDFGRDAGTRAHKARVHAQWGLIARGAEAVPFAVSLLQSPIAESREDAASVLAAIGADATAVAALIRTAERETDPVASDAMIQALGRMKAKEAIPLVARTLREGDPDSQWDAAESLGRIANKRFGDGPDRVAKALAWLESQRANENG